MALVDRLKRFLRTPQGQKARARAERMARDPRTQAKVRGILAKLRGGGKGRPM